MSTSDDPQLPSLHLRTAEPALAVYVEPLVRDRRVLVVGDASRDVGGALVESGARSVHVYDPDPARAARVTVTPRGVVVRPLPVSFEVRDGAFDCAVVTDLGAVPSPDALLESLARLVADDGAVVVVARNGAAPHAEGGFDYTELFDLVALRFERVRMFAILPFAGALVAELGLEEEPEVSVDTRLGAEAPIPERFCVVASRDDVAVDSFSIVELPHDAFGRPEAADRAALAEMTLKAEVLAAQVDDQRTRISRLDAEASRARLVSEIEAERTELSARADDAEARAHEAGVARDRLAGELATARERAGELEALLARRDAELASLEGRLAGATRIAVEQDDTIASLVGRVAELEGEAAGPDLEGARVALEARAREVETRAVEIAARLEAWAGVRADEEAALAAAHAEELSAFEAQLRARARHIQELERELRRRETLVHELVAALEDAGRASASPAAAPPSPARADVAREESQALTQKLDALALELARRTSELEAERWRAAELEGKLSRARASSGGRGAAPSETPGTGEGAGELEALRAALAQEHAARVRAESGEALREAHRRLAEQDVLLAQAAAEPLGR